MRFLLAFDSYKGCLTSQQAAQAAAGPLQAAGHSVHTIVLSDGGEGWCEAWHALSGGTWHTVPVHDPLMRRIEARYLLTPHGTAYLESAAACGLHLLAPAERNPMKATSYGLGELIAHAVLGGARRLVVGLGGTATCDCGIGMLHALIHLFARGKQFADARATVLGRCRFIAATDVTAPLCGEHGATYTFAPQKGATPSMLPLLEERAARFSRLSAAHMGCNRACDAGAGAAGGLGYALMQYLDAEVESGADLLLRAARFSEQVSAADVVLTGEGRSDAQTLQGKLPQRVMQQAAACGVPVWLFSGQVAQAETLRRAGFAGVCPVTPPSLPLSEALQPATATRLLADAVRRTFLA